MSDSPQPYTFRRQSSNRQLPAVELRIDPAQHARLTRELDGVKNGVQRAIVSAINRTLTRGRTLVVNELRDLLTVKRTNIFERTDVRKADLNKPEGAITVMGRRIGLANFKHTASLRRPGRAGGITVQLFRDGKVHLFKHAFLGIGLNDNEHLFNRNPKKRPRQQKWGHHRPNLGKIRQPIRAFYGLSLLRAFEERRDVSARVHGRLQEIFDQELNRQVARLTAGSR